MAHSDADGSTRSYETDARVVVAHEGETTDYGIEEFYGEASLANSATLSILARVQGWIAEGSLADEVMHNENVVERALEEDDVFFAEIGVPYWFKSDDDEVYDTFGDDDRIFALVENYSDGAFRIIASENGTPGDTWFNYEWTFVPKSLATVTRVAGVTGSDDAATVGRIAFDAEQSRRDREKEQWENADGWEEKLAVVDGDH